MENKIYDYISTIKTMYSDKRISLIQGIVNMENETTNEDISVYRVIEVDDSRNNICIYDYEYSNDEKCLLEWTAKLDYNKGKKYIDKYGDIEFLYDAESVLLDCFLFTDKILLN